jgi:hypothetical protein
MSLANLILKATAKWKKQRTAEICDHRAALRRTEALRPRYRLLTLKDAAAMVMEQAYLKASANGTPPPTRGKSYRRAVRFSKRPAANPSTATISPRRCSWLRREPFRTNEQLEHRLLTTAAISSGRTRAMRSGLGTLNVRAYVRSIAALE